VLYTNLLAIPGMALFMAGDNEASGFFAFVTDGGVTAGAWALLFLSTIVGTGISYSGWSAAFRCFYLPPVLSFWALWHR